MFKHGDRVNFVWEGNTYIGTFLKSSRHFNTVLFDKPSPKGHLSNDKSIELFINRYPLTLDGPIKTTEEKVQIKCQLLWNNSNWVKSHPHLFY